MTPSLTYRITLFVLKLKGMKKDFSQNPIDYKKIRKDDIHTPSGRFLKKYNTRTFSVYNSTITEVIGKKKSNKLVIFVHGGAFISGPSMVHWEAVKEISRQTSQTLWLCDYPKAPETKITEISKNIELVYQSALEQYNAHNITLIGDSAGGNLIATLVQRLVQNNLQTPGSVILVSPVMDASISNPDIVRIDKTDPILSKTGVLSAKKMCAGQMELNDPMMSPLFGSFEHFPSTLFFLAQNDITYPDQKLAVAKMKKQGVDLQVVEGENMPHIWPYLPVMKEAKTAMKQIIKFITR